MSIVSWFIRIGRVTISSGILFVLCALSVSSRWWILFIFGRIMFFGVVVIIVRVCGFVVSVVMR